LGDGAPPPPPQPPTPNPQSPIPNPQFIINKFFISNLILIIKIIISKIKI